MNIAESMKSLTEQIIISHDMRIKALGDLVIDTKKTLQDFHKDHQHMSSKQAKDLAKGESDRLKDFKAMMGDIQKDIKDIETYVENKLKGFHEDHRNMSDEQAKDLAKGESDRLKGFKAMMGDIQKDIKDIETYVENKLKGFHEDHRNMSDEQAKNLANFVVDLTKHVGNMMKGIQKAHKEMADNLNKSLGKGESDRLKDFKAMMGDIQKYVSGIVSDTKKLLSEYSSDMMKTSNIWNGMSKTMAKARKGGAVAPKVAKVAAEVKVMPVKEAIKEAAKEVEEKEASPEMDLEEKILGFIKSHPEGVKVGDMETALGATRMRLGIIAKKLLDEGKVRKEENQYFQL